MTIDLAVKFGFGVVGIINVWLMFLVNARNAQIKEIREEIKKCATTESVNKLESDFASVADKMLLSIKTIDDRLYNAIISKSGSSK